MTFAIPTAELVSAKAPSRRGSEGNDPTSSRSSDWARPALVCGIVIVLAALGVANIGLRARWHEVEDGVFWDARPEGVTAVEVAPGSAAAAAGIARGDLLIAVNGAPIQSPSGEIGRAHV